MPPRRTTRTKATEAPAKVEEASSLPTVATTRKRATRGSSSKTEAPKETSIPTRKRTTQASNVKKAAIKSDEESADELEMKGGEDSILGGKDLNAEDEDDEMSLPPKRGESNGRKTSKVASGSRGSKKKPITHDNEVDGDEDAENSQPVPPKATRTRKVSTQMVPQKETGRSARLSEEPSEERIKSEDQNNPDMPVSFRRASARISARRSQTPTAITPESPSASEMLTPTLANKSFSNPKAGGIVPLSPELDNLEDQTDEEADTLRRNIRPKTPERNPAAEPDLMHLITPAKSSIVSPMKNLALTSPKKKEGPAKRLVIHKMVLVNFKSYAGRQEIGPFHKSFSAIVGPNGSGKSNTIDALLFVFGYRANKMRQGKLSELIHNSAKFQDLDNCSVEIWFREIVDLPGPDNYLVVPDSQLIVARTAFRNNSSKYMINNRNSTFTEVTTLLKARGIDLDHKRFLILQGEVESIAQMKPKAPTEHEDGLLEYLEDIIGTSKYKQPIEQAQLDVDSLNEDRADKLNRLRTVEKEKSSLEAKKREAEDFLRDTNELTRKKSLLWQFHMYTLNSNIEITNKTIEALERQLETERETNASHLSEIAELQKAYEDKLEAAEEVKTHVDALQKDLKKLEKEEVGLSEKRKHLATKYKKLKKNITDDGHARSEALSWVENHSEEIIKSRKSLEALEKKLIQEEAELEDIRDSLKDKTDEFTQQIETKQLELQPWSAKINDKQSALDVAEKEKTLLLGKASGLRKSLDEAIEALQQLKDEEGNKSEERQTLIQQKSEQTARIKSATKKLENMSSESLRDKVTTARQKADEAKSSMAANKSQNAVLATLTKLRDQGRLQGFHGRLGDLGIIDDKYDVAITTACGALNNLVVDTVEQGQACIEYLRKGNVGRASIMVLEKLPARDLGPIKTPENVPRVFDLIKPKDSKFAPAFYKAVMNTLVADNLEQAQRIGFGKQRWRVVTLAGQVIDPSGTMSGGGARVQRGGMSSKYTPDRVEPEVLAKLERDLVAAEQEMAAFAQNRKALEIELAALKRSIPQLEMTIEKLELDLETSDKRKADAKARVDDLKSQSKPDAADDKRITVLEGDISAAQRQLETLRSKSAPIEEQIKELQNRILEVGGVKLRAIQSKVTNTKNQIDMANEAITKAEVGQAKNERDAEKMEKSIAGNTEKLEELGAELQAVEEDLKASTSDRQLIEENVKDAVDAMETVHDTLSEAKAEWEEASTSINAFRALEMDIKQKLEDNTRVQKESKNKLKHWANRHQELELVHIDEEDEDEQTGPSAELKEDGMEVDEEEKVHQDAPKQRARDTSTELSEYSEDELQDVNRDVLNAEIAQLEEEIGKAKPNLNVLAEYRKRESDYLERANDLENTTSMRDQAKKRYDDLRKTRLDEFMTGFSAISSKLKEMYQMITLGGNAELELVDSMDPFSEGIIFSVMPPKKSWKNISNLSGGEKTLSSLALVFALHVFKPTPLYFMDEIDAALDFRNVSIIANYIKSKTEAAQFIIISLRNDMFELAHRLVGIYKTSNCTKSVAIDNKDLRLQGVKQQKDSDQTPSQAKPLPLGQISVRPPKTNNIA